MIVGGRAILTQPRPLAGAADFYVFLRIFYGIEATGPSKKYFSGVKHTGSTLCVLSGLWPNPLSQFRLPVMHCCCG